LLRGAFTALVTPFTSEGELDETAFRRLVRWQILAGIDGLVPCGTTGESPTLSTDERERLIAATVEVTAERASRGRVRVVAGTGTNDTAHSIHLTEAAHEVGVDGFIREVRHALAVIDGYGVRFVRLHAAQERYVAAHKVTASEIGPAGIVERRPPSVRRIPDRELRQARRVLVDAVTRFLERCQTEGLVADSVVSVALAEFAE
jgi:hypothetical protein